MVGQGLAGDVHRLGGAFLFNAAVKHHADGYQLFVRQARFSQINRRFLQVLKLGPGLAITVISR